MITITILLIIAFLYAIVQVKRSSGEWKDFDLFNEDNELIVILFLASGLILLLEFIVIILAYMP